MIITSRKKTSFLNFKVRKEEIREEERKIVGKGSLGHYLGRPTCEEERKRKGGTPGWPWVVEGGS